MINKIITYKSYNYDLAIVMLRFVFGVMLMTHGYHKLITFNEILPNFPDMIGIGSKLSLILVIFAEFFCAFFVAVGFLTRMSLIPIIIAMSVAGFVAHANNAFSVKELSLLYLLLAVVIFVFGSGKFSLDKLLFKKSGV